MYGILSFFKSNNTEFSYKIGFEDVAHTIRQGTVSTLLISTLSVETQDCLIQTTLPYDMEERTINDILVQGKQREKRVIIYGKNSTDSTPDQKYKQLLGLGFNEVYVYSGGLFEWMLLQDIYGQDEFPTTKKVLDILKWKPASQLTRPRIGY
jgi:Rhodanese-like domain